MNFVEKMETLYSTVDRHKFDSARVFAFSEAYGEYVVLDIITSELTRNLLLALFCVFVATLFFLAHLFSSLIVVLNVFITLVNVGGYMHFWGLTIETATSIFLTISMGLSVDYSAHVCHAFMVAPGRSRNQRMKKV
jgi:Niemann-Pick C1 protein